MRTWKSLRNKMIILGVDPGLRATGYGVIEISYSPDYCVKLIEAGTINPKTQDLLENRLKKIYQNLTDIIQQYTPQIMVLEKLYAHHKHPTTASLLGHVRGVICLTCAENNFELVEHSVKRIRKSVVGNGAATKQQTQRAVERALKIDTGKLTLDASDALALALGYSYMNRL
jgi:crossover junction endodeoxyribonuclease RuvC